MRNAFRPIGKLLDFRQSGNQIDILTQNLRCRLTVYRAEVIRIQATDYDQFEANPFAVIAEPESVDMSWYQSGDQWLLETTELRISWHITDSHLRFERRTELGWVLLSEDALTPKMGMGWQHGGPCHYRKIQSYEHFIGLGEKTGHLDRHGQAYYHWNTDAFGYGVNADPLYASIPFFMGVHSGQCYGIFYDNAHPSRLSFGAGNNGLTIYHAEGGDLDFYFISGGQIGVKNILAQYTWLTGRMPLPPKWSLGLQQCRYSYYPEAEVRTLADTFRKKAIPCDVIYLDIHYMEDYKVFTFDNQRFPNPKGLMDWLEKEGFRVVTIVDPGVKSQPHYAPYESGKRADVFLKYPDGTEWHAQVWPGWCAFPDFTAQKNRDWWAQWVAKFLTESGVAGIWNDMNEPACWGQAVPDAVMAQMENKPAGSKSWHNLYGMQMMRASFEGLKKAKPQERPFVLTRAGYAGLQRFGAVWTGDNQATDDHMLLGVRLINSLGLSGVPMAAMDIGGFEGLSAQNTYTRWIQLGCFMPMFRIHTMVDNRDQEPWALGETVESISRSYVNLRYRLLPYLYGAFLQANLSGLPVQRSLAIDYWKENNTYDWRFENQYFFGDALLICPVKGHAQFERIWLPPLGENRNWYDFWSGTAYQANQDYIIETPLHLLPVFVKAGSMIPMQSLVQHTGQKPEGVLDIHLYPIHVGSSEYHWYEDDGISPQSDQLATYERSWTLNPFELVISEAKGSFKSQFHTYRLLFHGQEAPHLIIDRGMPMACEPVAIQLLETLPNFNPVGNSLPVPSQIVRAVSIPIRSEAMVLRFDRP